MKKLLCLVLSAVLVLSLSGCSILMARKEASVQKVPVASEIVPSKNIASVEESSDEVTSKTEQVKGINQTVVCPIEDSMYPAASLELKDDFTFKMQVNLYEGFGDISGTYETEDNGDLSLRVTEKNFTGFAGDTLESFKLIKKSDTSYEIKLDGEEQVGMLHSGAILYEE